MMAPPVFVLDANVFVQAHRQYYAFDLGPEFWAGLVECASRGRIESVDRVKIELCQGNDDLAAWANGPFSHAFAATDGDDVVRAYRDIMAWAVGQRQFSDAAKVDFARSADGWLVAYAKARDRIVVTHEALSLDIKKKVPIPNVCRAFGVRYVNTFQMMRELGLKWA